MRKLNIKSLVQNNPIRLSIFALIHLKKVNDRLIAQVTVKLDY